LTYRSSSVIELYIDQTVNTYPRIYTGNSRSNLTELIEGNAQATVGAPYEVPVDEQIMLLVKSEQIGGTLKISYKVSGEKYPWWEYIFLGQTQVVYYIGLSGLVIVFALCCCLPGVGLLVAVITSPATTLSWIVLCCCCGCYCCRK